MNHDIILKKPLPNQKTVVILGNARSGTSLISGILTKMGISMDSQYGKPDEYVPKGYYEIQSLMPRQSTRFIGFLFLKPWK